MRIAICTWDNRPTLNWIQLSNQSKERYCKRYEFDFVFGSTPYYNDRKPNWNKLPFLLEALNSGYDYVVWMDSDAIVANPSFDVSSLLDDHDIYFSQDCYGLNSGVFALKNSDISRQLLTEAASDSLREKYKNSDFQDQSTLTPLITEKYRRYAKEIPIRTWNSFDDIYCHPINNKYEHGDFILHCPDEPACNLKHPDYRYWRFSQIIQQLPHDYKAALITSHSHNNQEVFELTSDNHFEYCKRHGYEYIPKDEPYNKYVDTKYLLSIIPRYDFIVTMGVDLWIQHPEIPIEQYLRQGITMCPQPTNQQLNADFIVWRNCKETFDILNEISRVQPTVLDGQRALNQLYKTGFSGIYSEQYMQIAAPSINPVINEKGINSKEYFALHFHTLGISPNVSSKINALKSWIISL